MLLHPKHGKAIKHKSNVVVLMRYANKSTGYTPYGVKTTEQQTEYTYRVHMPRISNLLSTSLLSQLTGHSFAWGYMSMPLLVMDLLNISPDGTKIESWSSTELLRTNMPCSMNNVWICSVFSFSFPCCDSLQSQAKMCNASFSPWWIEAKMIYPHSLQDEQHEAPLEGTSIAE